MSPNGLRRSTTDPPIAAVASVWVDSAVRHLRRPIDEVIAASGCRMAAYLVTESEPLAHRGPTPGPGLGPTASPRWRSCADRPGHPRVARALATTTTPRWPSTPRARSPIDRTSWWTRSTTTRRDRRHRRGELPGRGAHRLVRLLRRAGRRRTIPRGTWKRWSPAPRPSWTTRPTSTCSPRAIRPAPAVHLTRCAQVSASTGAASAPSTRAWRPSARARG